MNTKNTSRPINFPENKEIGATLLVGEREKIAKYSKYCKGTINDMMNGYRRLTERAKVAIIQVLKERMELDSSFEEIISASTRPETKPDSGSDARDGSGNIPCAFE